MSRSALCVLTLIFGCGPGRKQVPTSNESGETQAGSATSSPAGKPAATVRRGEIIELGSTGGELSALACKGEEVAWANMDGSVSRTRIGAGAVSSLGQAPDTVMGLAQVAGRWYAATSGDLPETRGRIIGLGSGAGESVAEGFRFPLAVATYDEKLLVLAQDEDKNAALFSFDPRTRGLAKRAPGGSSFALSIAAGPRGVVIANPERMTLLPFPDGAPEKLPAGVSAAWAGEELALLRQTADENVCELIGLRGQVERVLASVPAHVTDVDAIVALHEQVCVPFSGTSARKYEDGSVSCVSIKGGTLTAVGGPQRRAKKLRSCGDYLVWLRNGDELVAFAPPAP